MTTHYGGNRTYILHRTWDAFVVIPTNNSSFFAKTLVCQAGWICENNRNRAWMRIELMSTDIWQASWESLPHLGRFLPEEVFVALHRWQLSARFDGTKGKWPSETRCGSLPRIEHNKSNMRHSFHLRVENTVVMPIPSCPSVMHLQ